MFNRIENKAAVTILIAIVGLCSSSFADTSKKSSSLTLCEAYNNTYEGANKSMASIKAEGYGDNSAIRATTRHLRMLNERMLQVIVIQQMKAHGCSIPKITSGGVGYLTHALECQTEKIKGRVASPECDTSKWKNILSDLKHFQ